MVLFEEAASDEKNPIVLFCIATTNIIVSQNAKDSILAVIVQNCIKGLQSDKPAARGYAISTLANISLQSTTSSSKLDDALVKKLLKYSLRNESPMNSEALACMGIVYFSSSGEVALPTKFASIAVDLIGRDDIKLRLRTRKVKYKANMEKINRWLLKIMKKHDFSDFSTICSSECLNLI